MNKQPTTHELILAILLMFMAILMVGVILVQRVIIDHLQQLERVQTEQNIELRLLQGAGVYNDLGMELS